MLDDLLELRADLLELEAGSSDALALVHPAWQDSARNLLHYLALRRRDLRPLQGELTQLGLSSLGRAESHVLAAINAVISVLHRLMGRPEDVAPDPGTVSSFAAGQTLLRRHTDDLLGPPPPARDVRIMVTMPGEAADDYALVHDLLQTGMDCMRINCAHDTPDEWARMIGHLRRAEQATGRHCKVSMDLGGPKLRTGPIEPGPAVIKLRPNRDDLGRVIAPCRVWLFDEASPQPAPTEADGTLALPATWLIRLRPGDRIKFHDARDQARQLHVVEVTADGVWCEADETCYLIPGLKLRHHAADGNPHHAEVELGAMPRKEGQIRLNKDDRLVLTAEAMPGKPATHDASGRVLTPAHVSCTLPEVFADVRIGERVWFDDGRIGGIVEKVMSDRLQIKITQTRPGGDTLLADKGINLPDSVLHLPALTDQDREDLIFAAKHADLVALSFASRASDVAALREELEKVGGQHLGVILKIETRRGFDHLPAMLLETMRGPCSGVMIARGDLAVECGFDRLAEVQEEILWVCEAAHIPVIWATQVLETLAKRGTPSRAEITDAAMSHRAECVMLNKGPHILDAVRLLDDILRRMQSHQSKKRAMLRELRLAHGFPTSASDSVERPLQ